MARNAAVSGSLRNRLVLRLIGGAAILALLLFFVVRNYAAQVAQQGQDNILRASVTSVLDAAAIRDGVVEVDIPYAAFSMLSTASDDRIFYAIYQDATLLSGYPNLAIAPAPNRTTTFETTTFATVPHQGVQVRVVTASRVLIATGKRTEIRVALAQTGDALAGQLEQISNNAALLGAGFFGLAIVLSFWATSATIAPLMRLTTSVTRRGPQDLSPFEKPVPSEMLPLVTSLNSLMGRLDHSLTQSEDFIAEAAHRVRTPLATVRSYAEATLQRVDHAENRQAMRAMMRAIDEASRAAGQLLDHAMITFRSDHLDRQDIDLAALVHELVQRLTPIAEMKDLTLEYRADGRVAYSGDPILIQNAVRNLLDNALKYAPGDGGVTVVVTATPSPSVTVRDNGRGFPDAELDTLTARFTRGTNAQGSIGSGLGLTIAMDVALAHGGSLRLSNPAEGGACAELLL